jgi:predicted nuclease of predicted toxin-antitoxin system
MRIKLDENLPQTLAEVLNALGHDADSVNDEGLAGHPDGDVWRAAQEEGRFLITQDVRFADARMFTPGAHVGLMLVRLKASGRVALRIRITEVIANSDVSSWAGCFVVVSHDKVRVRRARTSA